MKVVTTVIGAEVTYFLVALACTAVMLPGALSYTYLAASTRRRTDLAVMAVSWTALLTGLTRTATVGVALYAPDLETATLLNRFYEIALVMYLPVIPMIINAFIDDEESRIAGFHRVASRLGLFIFAFFSVIILVFPRWYQVAAPVSESTTAANMGRGPKGPVYFASSILLFLACIYTFAFMAVQRFRLRNPAPFLTTLSLGIGLSVVLILSEFYYLVFGRFPLIPSTRAYSRVLVGLVAFSMTAVLAMTQKSANNARDLEEDRKELTKSRDELERVAYTDEMTGYMNRPALFRDMEALARPPWILLVADIDGLAYANNYHGYRIGDELIIRTGDICRKAMPSGGRLYRSNADTFAVLMEGTVTDVEALADRILAGVRQLRIPGAEEDQFTVSIGIARAGESISWEEWINRCDTAMEHAKTAKNRAVVFNPEIHADEKRRHDIIAGLRRSLDESGFNMRYQPIITAEKAVVGAEALVRWEHPELGPVGPDEFIPLAEATGLISRLTRFVVDRTLTDFCGMDNSCLDLKVNVNLSGRDVTDKHLISGVQEIVSGHPGSRGLLGFEVTETDLIGDWEQSLRNLRALRESGYSIALDDFGTGYSSLSYLNVLPLDKLKIDRSFIADLPDNLRKIPLLDAIIRLGQDLGLDLVVEGVEDSSQLDFLIARDCRFFQGYFFAPPMTIGEFTSWMSGSGFRQR